MTLFVSFWAITAAVTPAVATDDTPIAVATTTGTDTTNRFDRSMDVPPLCSCKKSVVNDSNMLVRRWNFFVGFSRGDHLRPWWQRFIISSEVG